MNEKTPMTGDFEMGEGEFERLTEETAKQIDVVLHRFLSELKSDGHNLSNRKEIELVFGEKSPFIEVLSWYQNRGETPVHAYYDNQMAVIEQITSGSSEKKNQMLHELQAKLLKMEEDLREKGAM